jgi:tetratricopeptide (TPR) repeat protein
MADEIDDVGAKPVGPDAVAARMALDTAAAEQARDYLQNQNALARLQIENLQKQDEFETSHLRWRRFNDQMKGAMQIMLVVIGALFVFAIAAAVWSAAHDDGVVIEAFNVPPDMQSRGLTGSVVSSMLLDKLTALQSQIDSARAPSSYASNGDDIKVLIPDTGISIGEAYRYLSGWLGHQTHISGDVYRSAKGITVVVRTGGDPGTSFEGSESDLNALMGHAAEAVYRQTQPFRYGVHLLNEERLAEADKVLGDLARNGPDSEKPWAYANWMYTALLRGDMATAIARARTAAALGPNNPLAQGNASQVEAGAGHDEQELRYDYAEKDAAAAGGESQVRPSARVAMEHGAVSNIGEETGDFPAALAQYDQQLNEPDFVGSRWTAVYMKAVDLAKLHDVAASRRALGGFDDASLLARTDVGSGWNQSNFDFPQFEQFSALDDWTNACKDIERAVSAVSLAAKNQFGIQTMPLVALAQARSGDVKAAWATIAKLPLDCYLCLRVRGQTAAMEKDWNGSQHWFARATGLAPSIPFAYVEWGQLLMAKGDFDGAIAKFEVAHQKGPHFADPLEMWGEALIAKNRSDLALAKFEEANKYAPNWGRLHLKWGEALLWSGDKSGAQKQFAAAAHLDLTPSEKSELTRMGSSHG